MERGKVCTQWAGGGWLASTDGASAEPEIDGGHRADLLFGVNAETPHAPFIVSMMIGEPESKQTRMIAGTADEAVLRSIIGVCMRAIALKNGGN